MLNLLYCVKCVAWIALVLADLHEKCDFGTLVKLYTYILQAGRRFDCKTA